MSKKTKLKRNIETPKKKGRPTTYSKDLADELCRRISHSKHGINTICKDESMPCEATIYNWLNDPTKKYFLECYMRAREAQADFLGEEILSIADETENDTLINPVNGNESANTEWINRSRLRVDARKWLMSKLAPKKYGDKLDVTTGGDKLIFNVKLTDAGS
jgi:hypothetical protein